MYRVNDMLNLATKNWQSYEATSQLWDWKAVSHLCLVIGILETNPFMLCFVEPTDWVCRVNVRMCNAYCSFRICRQETWVRCHHPRHSGIICFKLKSVGDNRLDGTKLIQLRISQSSTMADTSTIWPHLIYQLYFILESIPVHPCSEFLLHSQGVRNMPISTTADRQDTMWDTVVLLQSSC